MINLINNTITDTANKSGIANIIDDVAGESLTITTPYVTIEHLSESFDETGYTLAGVNNDEKIKIVLTKYLVHHPVICTIVTDNTDSTQELSDKFIANIPRILSDKFNNIVKVKILESSWDLSGSNQAGDTKIDPIIKYSRHIKIEFSYHITQEREHNYIRKVDISILNKRGESQDEQKR